MVGMSVFNSVVDENQPLANQKYDDNRFNFVPGLGISGARC